MNNSSNIGIGVNTPLEKLHVNGGILISNTVQTQANNGTIRWNGTDFQGKKNGDWVSFTGIGLQGQPGDIGPRGITGYPGGDSNWPKADNNNLYYTDGNVGIGITGGQNSEKLMIRANSTSDPALNIYGKTQVSGNIIPEVNNTYELGSITNGWKNVYMNTAIITTGIQIETTDAIKLPKGTTAQRPTGTSPDEKGSIRYNTELDAFEGLSSGNNWITLGGVIDADRDTYIKAETTPNDDNDELQFFTGGVERMKILSDGKTQVVGNIVPALTNTTDLGSSTKVWKNVYTETAVVSKGVQIGNADDVSPNGTIRFVNNTFQVRVNNKWYYLLLGMVNE